MAEKNVTRIAYKLENFDKERASSGALCAIVDSTVTETPEGHSFDNVGSDGTPNPLLVGFGVCTLTDSRHYNITVNSTKYQFDNNGNWTDSKEGSKLKIMIATVLDPVSYSGNVVDSSTTPSETRNKDGEYDDSGTIEYKNVKKAIEALYPRDHFAIEALKGIMSKVDEPHALSDSVMNMYCGAAYQWAANMMAAAANSRGILNDETESGTTKTVEVGALDNNTDKLLNNLIAEMERNDEATTGGVWKKSGQLDITGAYTDEVAQTLGEYTNIAEAEADGWYWVATSYAERITLKDVNMSGIEALINQLRGAYKVGATQNYYNMSLFEHNYEDWLRDLTKKLSVDETRSTVGLDELVKAVKSITVDFTDLISAVLNASRKVTQMPTLTGTFDANINFTNLIEAISAARTVNLGSNSLGRDANHPIYISGGGSMPSRSAVSESFTADAIHDFTTFNTAGDVGFSSREEVVKAIWSDIETKIDKRINEWLSAAKDYEGRRLTVVTPDYR